MAELNFLYIALAVGFIVLVVFLCIVLWRANKVLEKMEETLGSVNRTADMVEKSVANVIPIVNGLTGAINLFMAFAQKMVGKMGSKSKKNDD